MIGKTYGQKAENEIRLLPIPEILVEDIDPNNEEGQKECAQRFHAGLGMQDWGAGVESEIKHEKCLGDNW